MDRLGPSQVVLPLITGQPRGDLPIGLFREPGGHRLGDAAEECAAEAGAGMGGGPSDAEGHGESLFT